MSLSQQKRKGYISFILGAVLTAVFSMFFFRSYGDFTVLNDSAPIAIYIISLVFGVFGGLVSYRAFSGGQFAVGDKKFFYPVLSFVITFAAILTAYVLLGIAPFGKETALVIDMYHQYSVFFVDLRERLEAGESLIYSLRLGLGGAFTPMFAYYLASPFNFIAMLFPTSAMSEGVALVELLKIAAAACTFSIFVSCNYGKRDFGVTLVSVMYALSSYIMAYSWNIMWLDCIVMLPLVALGLNKLIREGKYLLYCLSLGICLLSNFYIGFMVCIALVLYFLSIVAAENKISWRAFFSRAGRFALGSVIGGGIAAVLIIPTYMALRLTSSANDVFPSLWQTNFNIADLLSQQYFGMPVGIDYGNLPNIYCGVLAVVLLPVYVLNGKIPVRRKLCELGFLGVMAASLVLNKTDWIWHGLHYPNGL
ncbi:MAG: YfhO family protein, partial [Clostridia bacterium]|nr:YfhO family protein [Clostridia bacterium]